MALPVGKCIIRTVKGLTQKAENDSIVFFPLLRFFFPNGKNDIMQYIMLQSPNGIRIKIFTHSTTMCELHLLLPNLRL